MGFLFAANGLHRIDPQRAAGREPAGDSDGRNNQRSDTDKHEAVDCPASADQSGDQAIDDVGQPQSDSEANGSQHSNAARNDRRDPQSGCPQRDPNSDLPRPAGYRKGYLSENAAGDQQQGNAALESCQDRPDPKEH